MYCRYTFSNEFDQFLQKFVFWDFLKLGSIFLLNYDSHKLIIYKT